MQAAWKLYLVQTIFVFLLVIKLEAVTVNPLCPTNKIAPHRRSSEDKRSARTIGAFYNLLVPDSPPSHLQEEPENDSHDCDNIEDYDENDLSSLTPIQNGENIRRNGYRHFLPNPIGAFFQGLSLNNRPQTTTTMRTKATRPPTGGYFGTNAYRPQPEQQPSANIKPVQESFTVETDATYRPVLVGVPSGQIVGALQVRPTRKTLSQAIAPTQNQYSNYAYPSYTPHTNTNKYTNRPRNMEDTGILESFIHLLF